VRFWVGITDYDWFRFLAAKPDLAEVNFWQPSASRRPVALEPGQLFLFKLHAAQGGAIVGGGFFVKYEAMPVRWTWDAFGEENGAATYDQMVALVQRNRHRTVDAQADQVGCLVLVEPFFLDESEWIAPPEGWAPNIVQGKWLDSDIGEGARIWDQVQLALARRLPMEHAIAEHRYGKPILVHPRLGQGAFRLLVTDAYQRRCAVTGERTLPVLDAAHIKPYAASGPHDLRNGLLLRKDLHALFDAGYVTVTPSLELRVSRRIREEFENGRDYYALDKRGIRPPEPPAPAPSAEFLEWHGDMVFRR
jgi:putative restriction endonuclease